MNLRAIRTSKNLTQVKLGELAGVEQATISRLEKGNKNVTLRIIEDVAKALNVNIVEIFGPSTEKYSNKFPTIPRHDARLSAGHGAINLGKTVILDHIPFTQEFLHQKLGRVSTDGLVCCDAMGESMEPLINHGDLLMIDTTLDNYAAGIYAINYNDESFVKRVEKIGKGFSLMSDNKAYAPITVQGHDINSFEIIGKIVWVGRTFQ